MSDEELEVDASVEIIFFFGEGDGDRGESVVTLRDTGSPVEGRLSMTSFVITLSVIKLIIIFDNKNKQFLLEIHIKVILLNL